MRTVHGIGAELQLPPTPHSQKNLWGQHPRLFAPYHLLPTEQELWMMSQVPNYILHKPLQHNCYERCNFYSKCKEFWPGSAWSHQGSLQFSPDFLSQFNGLGPEKGGGIGKNGKGAVAHSTLKSQHLWLRVKLINNVSVLTLVCI